MNTFVQKWRIRLASLRHKTSQATQRNVTLPGSLPEDYETAQPANDTIDASYQQVPAQEAAGYQPELASPGYHKSMMKAHGVQYTSHGWESVFRSKFVRFAAIACSLGIWFYMFYGNVELFSLFHPFELTPNIIMPWLGGFVVETTTLALIFIMSIYLEKRKWVQFGLATVAAIVSSAISAYCQFQYVAVGFSLGYQIIPAALVQYSFGHGIETIAFLRAIGLTLIEFCLVFVLVDRYANYKETIKENEAMQKAEAELRRSEKRRRLEAIADDAVVNLFETLAVGAEELVSGMRDNQEQIIKHILPRQVVWHLEQQQQLPEQAQSQMPKKQPAPKRQNVGSTAPEPEQKPARPPQKEPQKSDGELMKGVVQVLRNHPGVTPEELASNFDGDTVKAAVFLGLARKALEKQIPQPVAGNGNGNSTWHHPQSLVSLDASQDDDFMLEDDDNPFGKKA